MNHVQARGYSYRVNIHATQKGRCITPFVLEYISGVTIRQSANAGVAPRLILFRGLPAVPDPAVPDHVVHWQVDLAQPLDSHPYSFC